MKRDEIASLIVKRLKKENLNILKERYKNSSKINYLLIEDLLPFEIAKKLDLEFPKKSFLNLRSEPQERKYIAVEWNSESKLVEECLYAFQEINVLEIFSEICGIDDLIGDPELYAGGVSFMDNGCFLNPHIDNSHDRLKEKFRRLNLLYYVSNGWNSDEDGGELMLFPEGITSKEVCLPPKFNSLVIMRTDNKSLHAVNKIKKQLSGRKCISNYYFSFSSPSGKNYYHSTSFRGFKGEKYKGSYLRINAFLRTVIKSNSGKIFGKIFNTGHHRKKKN